MRAHCGWCGRFVSADTLPTPGYNAALDVVTQLLCPDCNRSWVNLSEHNIKRYQERTEGGADKVWSGYQEKTITNARIHSISIDDNGLGHIERVE